MGNFLFVKYNRGAFFTSIEGVCHRLGDIVIRSNIVIDTGCMYTNIPLLSAGISKEACSRYKREDIIALRNNELRASFSRGIETGNIAFPKLEDISDDEIMKSPAIGFKHILSDVRLGMLKIAELPVKINYDRTSSMLLGMNVLRNYEIHIGLSRVDNESIGIDKGDCILLAINHEEAERYEYDNTLNTYLGYKYYF